jgi:hypothetical protein
MDKLYCWILNESERPFPVEIANSSETVAQLHCLQRAILKVKPAVLSGLDPDQLAIQKVSFVNFCQLHALITPPRKVSVQLPTISRVS